MNSADPYVRKTCKSCLENVKIYITCSTCDAAYHVYCLNQVPGAYVDPQGQLFCCGNITSKYDASRKILNTEDDPLQKVKEEDNQDDYKEDLENCLPDEDSEGKTFECESCYSKFTKKEHLEGHYNECPYIIQGGLIQDIKRDKELENCLHKEEDLEWTEFKCDACFLELMDEEHLQTHYKECPDKQRGLLQGLDKDTAGLVCSFCSRENFQEESYEQHIKRCEEYYSELNKVSDVHRISMKRKQTHVGTNKRLFKCNKCDYTTKRCYFLTYHILSKHCDGKKRFTHIEYTLERHLRTHTSQKPFKCNQCGYRTALKRSLNTHMKVKHSIHKKSNQVRHIRSHTSKRLNKASKVRRISMKRKQAHIRANKQLFKCNRCDYVTKRCHLLTYHILLKHYDGKKQVTPIEYTLERHLRTRTSQNPFKCNRCDYQTAGKRSFNMHMKVKHSIHTNKRPFKCDTCNYSAICRRDLNYHILAKHSNAEKKYKCSDCKYSTHHKSTLVKHIRIHTNERPFKCNTCTYAATSKSQLNYHILEKHSNIEYKCRECQYSTHHKKRMVRHMYVHTNEKPFKCDTCDYSSTYRYRLNRHILVIHSNVEKKYKCNDCEYSAHLECNLTNHIRIHSNERPFKCDSCDYASTRRAGLNCHILAKHSDAEKKYKCHDCKYSTHQKSQLVRHTRVHNEKPFKCNTCDYAATQKTDLDHHILAKHSNEEKQCKRSDCKYTHIHTNEKPFKCDTCYFATSWKNLLKRHILVKHSNAEKKYNCNDCKYSTHDKGNLVTHTRIHANRRPFKCDTCNYTANRNDYLHSHVLARHSNRKKKY